MKLQVREVRAEGKLCGGCGKGIERGTRAASGSYGRGRIYFHADRVECARKMRKMGGMVVGTGPTVAGCGIASLSSTRRYGIKPFHSGG